MNLFKLTLFLCLLVTISCTGGENAQPVDANGTGTMAHYPTQQDEKNLVNKAQILNKCKYLYAQIKQFNQTCKSANGAASGSIFSTQGCTLNQYNNTMVAVLTNYCAILPSPPPADICPRIVECQSIPTPVPTQTGNENLYQ